MRSEHNPSTRTGKVGVLRSIPRPSSWHLHSRSPRHLALVAAITAGLVGVSGTIWSMPGVQRAVSGPTAEQVALQREQARAADLKGQVEQLSQRLASATGTGEAESQAARAEDLKAQLADAEAKLAASGGADDQTARANDLKQQLDAANAKLSSRGGSGSAGTGAPAGSTGSGGSGSGVSAPPAAPVTAEMTRDEIIASRNLFGLYTAQSPFNYAEFEQLEQAIDRGANVSGYFQSWATPFRADAVQAAWKRGQIPLLTWESQRQLGVTTADQPEFALGRIIEGNFDDYIRQYARDVAATGLPLVMRFDHEMNAGWYPWGSAVRWDPETQTRSILTNGNQPGEFVEMWRHVHGIFEAEGANDQVVWLWAPNRVDALPPSQQTEEYLAGLYPGDAYVDWVGLSAYLRNTNPSTNRFPETYDKTLGQLRSIAPAKPILIAETGAAETAGDKPAWVQDFFTELPRREDVIGFVWFNLVVSSDGNTHDWRINSTEASRQAFADGIRAIGYGKAR